MSGAQFLVARTGYLRSIVGPSPDIISFDPRGIAHSTPLLDCFATSTSEQDDGLTASSIRRSLWQLTRYSMDPSSVNDEEGLKRAYARYSAVNQLCNERDRQLGKSSIFRYSSTPYVVGDIIGILDAWSRWRQFSSGTASILESHMPDVNYWGFSYGSVLGATLAATHPERVGRVILDGIVDTSEWYGSQLFGDYSDADEILDIFPEYCQAAGLVCSFYKPGESAESIKTRMYEVLDSLSRGPVGFVNRDVGIPTILTHDLLMNAIFEGLYKPMTQFPLIADWLMAVESRNHTLMGELIQLSSYPLAKRSELGRLTSHNLIADYNEAINAVTCGDQQRRVSQLFSRVTESVISASDNY